VQTYTSEDIDDQTDPNNYVYDEIGQLIWDNSQGLKVSWNFMNKVSSVTSPNGTVTYAYNPMGQRIGKVFDKPDNSAKIDLYSRDAQGNTLAIYETERYCDGWKSLPSSGAPCKLITDSLKLSKLYIYGSSRLGELTISPDKQSFREVAMGTYKPYGFRYTHRAGTRRYELTNPWVTYWRRSRIGNWWRLGGRSRDR
jgi:YD repeat-containing protein